MANNTNITAIMTRISELVEESKKADCLTDSDIHITICNDVCNEFDLWSKSMRPIWVDYLVTGVMRDNGLLIQS